MPSSLARLIAKCNREATGDWPPMKKKKAEKASMKNASKNKAAMKSKKKVSKADSERGRAASVAWFYSLYKPGSTSEARRRAG